MTNEVNTSTVTGTALAVIGATIARFDAVEAGIADLSSRFAGVAYPVDTAKGMADAKEARMAIREPRYAVETARKDAKAPLLSLGKEIDRRAGEITSKLLEIETPIHEQIKAEEDRREQAREAKRRAEAERIRAHEEALAAISAPVMASVGKSANDIEQILIEVQANQPMDFEEYQPRAERAHADVLDKLAGLLDQARRREEAERKAAEERAELERQRAEQAERERIAAAQLVAERAEAERAAQAERDRLAAERAELEAKAKAERDKLAAERAEFERKQAEVLAEQRARERAEQEAKEAAERQAAAERKATEDAARRQAEEAKAAQDAADRRLRDAAPMMLAALERLVRDADAEPNGEYLQGANKGCVAVNRRGIEAARAAIAAATTEGGAA